MFRRSIILISVLAILINSVGGGQAYSNHRSDRAKALVQVFIQTSTDLSQFESTGLPVFSQLHGGTANYLLTAGNTDHLKSLSNAGLKYVILDTNISGGTYYLVSPMLKPPQPDWDTFGIILLDDGVQTLIRTTPDQAEELAQQGMEIRQLTFTPKPLHPSHNPPAFPTAVDPDPAIQAMIDQVTTPAIESLIGGLSGEWPVMIGGSSYTIATRNTYSGTPIQKATQYVGEQMAALGLAVEYHQWGGATYPNVIGELTGQENPNDIYMIGAHLDDMPTGSFAPGADDNASGSAATLLAANIFSQYQWACTLRFAFWTGEEQGLFGSEAYAQRAYNAGENIIGYLNLDMIAWNTGGSNPDIDLHTNSSLPATLTLAQLFADTVDAYNLNLIPEIIPNGTGFSDHASFWQYGFTSILGIEDYYGTGDFNPYYHTINDDMDNFQDWAYYTNFVKASLATFAHMSNCLIPSGMGYLDGTVTASDGGGPVTSATITAENADGQIYTTSTGDGGYYTQTLLADVYSVTASAYGYLPETLPGVSIVTDTVTTLDFALPTAPTYVVSGTVLETGTGLPLLAQIRALDTPNSPVWTDPVTGFYSITLPSGTYTLEASAEAHHSDQQIVVVNQDKTQNFVLDPLACILLVDDDNNAPDVRTYFTSALDTLGYGYDVFDIGGGGANGPDFTGLQGYHAVFWFSGDKYGGYAGPNSTDESSLSAYLDGGGHLFLSAQDYLYDVGLTPFGQNYLGVGSFINDSGDALSKYGVAGDPIGNGLGPYPLSYPAGFDDYGDIVNPLAPASVAFRSEATGGNNLDLDQDGGAWKTVFFSTDWVPIYNNHAGNGEEVLEQIMEWFGGCEPIPDITVAPSELSALLPPDTISEQVIQIGNEGEGVLAWSLSEQPPVSWLDETSTDGGAFPGTTIPITITFDTTDLKAGAYTTTLQITSNDPDEPLIQLPVYLTILCGSPDDLDFYWTPLAPMVGQPVTFTAVVTGTEPITLTWDFGDSSVGEGTIITHTFIQTGTFTVTLTAETACSVDSVSRPITVSSIPPVPPEWVLYLPIVRCYTSASP